MKAARDAKMEFYLKQDIKSEAINSERLLFF